MRDGFCPVCETYSEEGADEPCEREGCELVPMDSVERIECKVEDGECQSDDHHWGLGFCFKEVP